METCLSSHSVKYLHILLYFAYPLKSLISRWFSHLSFQSYNVFTFQNLVSVLDVFFLLLAEQ